MTRRTFMSRSAAAAAGLFMSSCFGSRVATSPTPRPTYGTPIPKLDTRWPVDRVIYLMMENRSFDNLFGRFPGANGARTGNLDGTQIPLRHCTEWLPGDLPHDRVSWEEDFNGGAMDGFDIGLFGRDFAYSQFNEADIPNYYHWAKEFVLGDNFFASVAGPSYPNHLFFIAGQAGGAIDNPLNIETKFLNDGRATKSWGCDAHGDDVYVEIETPGGGVGQRNTCFDFRSMGEVLSDRNIDWAFYSADPYEAGYIWQAYSSIKRVFHDKELWDEHIWPVDDLMRDIEANTLPPVTWVTPRFQLSDHPPFSTKHAHNWVTQIINAVMRSKMWGRTAIFITWDEWGGLYDHVRPPMLEGEQLGFRVPLLLISPFARRGYIDDALGEFSTPLRFISDNWGLPYLTPRIRNAHNFEHAFDFTQPPRPPDPRPPVKATNPYWVWPSHFAGWPPGIEPEKPKIHWP